MTEDVANNVAQGNSQDLTEQWRNGKLDHGWYYIKHRGAYKTDQWQGYYWENSWNENVEEVIAPVPSYEEWQYLLLDNKILKQCQEIDFGTAYTETVKTKAENQQLKELLNEIDAEYSVGINKEEANSDTYVIYQSTFSKLDELFSKWERMRKDNAIGENK